MTGNIIAYAIIGIAAIAGVLVLFVSVCRSIDDDQRKQEHTDD